MPEPQPPFDPSAPLPDFPPAPRKPAKPAKPHRTPGWGNKLLMILSVVGMAVFTPVLLKIRQNDSEDLFTAQIILPALGFLFSAIVFAATIGARVAFWIAEWFVDLIFSTHGGGYVEKKTPEAEAREKEEDDWYVRPATPPLPKADPGPEPGADPGARPGS